tara:strand:- start:908 stop:1168 length:261 start_codon:yes stop_codon:yes gene_type:complete
VHKTLPCDEGCEIEQRQKKLAEVFQGAPKFDAATMAVARFSPVFIKFVEGVFADLYQGKDYPAQANRNRLGRSCSPMRGDSFCFLF